MNARFLPIAVLVLSLALAGCVKIQTTQTLAPNGDLTTETKMDLGGLVAAAQSMGEGGAEELTQNLTTACPELQKSLVGKNASNVSCSVSGYVITASYKENIATSAMFSVSQGFPFITYTYRFGKHDTFANMTQGLEEGGQEFSKDMLKSAGVEAKYVLAMPGTLSKASVGEIKDNKLTVDALVVEPAALKDAYAESQELNIPYVAGAALLIILILAAALFLFTRKKAA